MSTQQEECISCGEPIKTGEEKTCKICQDGPFCNACMEDHYELWGGPCMNDLDDFEEYNKNEADDYKDDF